jgi:glyoxylase-like metal-dependent hydrolase (beta-lactamase superfamily II)
MNYRLHTLVESRFALDGGAMFGIIPKPLWERTTPADASNRIAMAARCLVLEDGAGDLTLVDAGMGTKWSARDRDVYRVEQGDDDITAGLRAMGLDPGRVRNVVLTHLHFDHVGGLTAHDAAGSPIPVFPHAVHWVQRENWVWAHHPTSRDAGSYRTENFRMLGTADCPQLELLDGDTEILPGIRVLPQFGHTPGMQLVEFTTSNQRCVFVADLFPTVGHIQPVWVMGYDLHPLRAVAEKEALLRRASDEDLVFAFEHDPTTEFGRPALDARGRWTVTPWSLPPNDGTPG